MLAESSAALSALSAIKDLVGGFVAERDATKVQEVRADLLQKVADSLVSVIALNETLSSKLDEISTLKEKVRDLEARLRQGEDNAAQFPDYELGEIAPSVYVYTPKPDAEGIRRPPYLCPACKGQGKYSVLNFQRALSTQHPARLQCGAEASHVFLLPRGWRVEHLGRPQNLQGN